MWHVAVNDLGKEGAMVALAPALAKLVNLTSLNLGGECVWGVRSSRAFPFSPAFTTTGIHRGMHAPPAHRGMHAHRLTVACMAIVVRRVV